MNHNRTPKPKALSTRNVFNRAFKAEIRKVKQKCEENTINLYSNESVLNTCAYVCVLSRNEYELGEPATNCDLTKECYFVSIFDYEKHFEE